MNLHEQTHRIKEMMGLISEDKSPWMLRRLGLINKYVDLALSRVPSGGYSYHDYVEEIVWQVLDEFGLSAEGEDLDRIAEYVREHYWELIQQKYFKDQE